MSKIKLINNYELSSQLYFNEISKFKSLSIDEEMCLWERYKKNNDLLAKEKLIKSNLKFVASVAKNFQGKGLSYSDLIAEGNCGLLKAFDKFDYKKNYKTISYSVWWIRQTILEALKERNGIKGDELPNDFEKQLNDDDIVIINIMENNNFITEDYDKIYNDEIKNITYNLIETLTEREKSIILKYFGINCNSQTLEEIGMEFGLTKERVRQIRNKALKKLRAEALTNSITSDIYK